MVPNQFYTVCSCIRINVGNAERCLHNLVIIERFYLVKAHTITACLVLITTTTHPQNSSILCINVLDCKRFYFRSCPWYSFVLWVISQKPQSQSPFHLSLRCLLSSGNCSNCLSVYSARCGNSMASHSVYWSLQWDGWSTMGHHLFQVPGPNTCWSSHYCLLLARSFPQSYCIKEPELALYIIFGFFRHLPDSFNPSGQVCKTLTGLIVQ